MALSSETSKQIFVCTGGTVYTVPFYFLQNADLTVYRQDADGNTSTLVLTTDYTLTGAGEESGGELTTVETFSDGKLVVVRNVAYTQGLDLIAGDGFRPDTLEKELDRIVMQVQQLARKVGVSFHLPDSDTSGASTELPSPEAGKVLAWNATGDAIVNEVPQYTVLENGSVTLDTIAALRLMPVSQAIKAVSVMGHTAEGDGGGGVFRYLSGAAPGTYVDDNSVTIVPSGGNGSAAWRQVSGVIFANTTLNYPGDYSDFDEIFNYLSAFSIAPQATVTVSVAEGVHTINGKGIIPKHANGGRIQIVGAGSGTTTLKFTGLGSATSKAGVQLVGGYELGYLDGVTLDGDDWSGHADGGPTLGAGDPNDPMGIQAKNGASITVGPDVVIYRFARNGVFAYQGSTIKADGVTVIECGSDAFVASTGSNVRAIGATAQDGWGVGFYADYTGTIWASGATATGMQYRGGTAGGDGYAANYAGQIYAENSTSVKNADTGYTCVGGNIFMPAATAGGSALNANTGTGVRVQSGGVVVGGGVTASYNGAGGLLVTYCGTFAGDSLTTNNNTGAGATVTDGSRMLSQGFISSSNSTRGLIVEKGSHASILQCDIQSNGGNGIEAQNSTVRATSAVAIKNNGGFGAQARGAAIIDMQGVSEGTIITGNSGGSLSPAKDTTTGIAQSFIYAAP